MYEPFFYLFKLEETIMNVKQIIITLIITTVSLTAFAISTQQEQQEKADAKSVAWYTANVSEARDKNKECYDEPKLHSTEDCKNSLHATTTCLGRRWLINIRK